jgi:hypothetical protein
MKQWKKKEHRFEIGIRFIGKIIYPTGAVAFYRKPLWNIPSYICLHTYSESFPFSKNANDITMLNSIQRIAYDDHHRRLAIAYGKRASGGATTPPMNAVYRWDAIHSAFARRPSPCFRSNIAPPASVGPELVFPVYTPQDGHRSNWDWRHRGYGWILFSSTTAVVTYTPLMIGQCCHCSALATLLSVQWKSSEPQTSARQYRHRISCCQHHSCSHHSPSP